MTYLGILLVTALLFGLGLLYLIFRSAGEKSRSRLDKKVVQEKWQEIEIIMSQGGHSNFQSAVIEADKLLDYALKSLVGNKNRQNMGERLKLARQKFSDYEIYQGVWEAHKVRNQLMHETHYELHSAVAKKTIEQFKRGFRNLGMF